MHNLTNTSSEMLNRNLNLVIAFTEKPRTPNLPKGIPCFNVLKAFCGSVSINLVWSLLLIPFVIEERKTEDCWMIIPKSWLIFVQGIVIIFSLDHTLPLQ